MLPHALTFSPEQDEVFFHEIPAAPAVFLLRGDGEPYVSRTADLRRRMRRLLGRPLEQSKRLNLRDRVRELAFTATGSDFESQLLLYRLLRETFPPTYAARLRLRPSPLVKLHLENEYPRASVTTRMGRIAWGQPRSQSSGSLYYGPFLSRVAAEKFASDALDFFKMRRCVEDLHPDPAFPGCVYSEMKMCLAPCFKGCTDEEYRAEVSRVREFFDTSGQSLTRELAQQRDRASSDLAFEEAAALHTKIEKLKPLLGQLPEIVQRVDQLRALIIQPSSRIQSVSSKVGLDIEQGVATESTATTQPEPPQSVCLFLFQNCSFAGPIEFSIGRAESQSMESRVAEAIATLPPPQIHSTAERMEHLSILKRWYYRSHRVGEVFFADDKGDWPFRRIVRGIGRVVHGENAQEPILSSATRSPAPPT